jgi:hypothetical protein
MNPEVKLVFSTVLSRRNKDMANMWPKTLPNWVTSDFRRSAEISVYKKLEKMEGSWSIFYSRPWWGITERGGERDGEADFIIAHPDHGLLFLEVKGGRISFNPETQQWHTKDRNNITFQIKDPVKQAMTCQHAFLRKLTGLPKWPKKFIRFRYGVVFPDSLAPSPDELSIGGYEKCLFCHAEEFDYAFEEWILQRLESHKSAMVNTESGPGNEGILALHELVAKPVSLRVPMSREVRGDIETMDTLLTGAQLALVSIIDTRPRVLVTGGAGTGKTILAVELAARGSDRGNSILFCCRNKPLSVHLKKRMIAFPNITVMDFDELASFCKWKEECNPQDLVIEKWNEVIIDEAQDFEREWWDLINIIASSNDAKIRVFADSNQAVYCLRDDLETRLQAESLTLQINLRNTKHIATVTETLYEGPLIEARGPEGVKPSVENCDFEPAINRGIEAAINLINEEQIFPFDISVLVPDASCADRIRKALWHKNIPVTDANQGISGVSVDTVDRFKGLESSVVLIISDSVLCRNQELSYIGVSRARARLFIFGPIKNSLLEKAAKCS